MKMNLTQWVAIAIMVTAAMLMNVQQTFAQCAANNAGRAASPGLAANGRVGNNPTRQGFNQGGLAQLMQQAQQMMRLQQQFGQKPSPQSPFARNNNRRTNRPMGDQLFANNSSRIGETKPAINQNSTKAKRIAKMKERRQAKERRKEEILAKRKADREKRIADFKKRKAEEE